MQLSMEYVRVCTECHGTGSSANGTGAVLSAAAVHSNPPSFFDMATPL